MIGDWQLMTIEDDSRPWDPSNEIRNKNGHNHSCQSLETGRGHLIDREPCGVWTCSGKRRVAAGGTCRE